MTPWTGIESARNSSKRLSDIMRVQNQLAIKPSKRIIWPGTRLNHTYKTDCEHKIVSLFPYFCFLDNRMQEFDQNIATKQKKPI